MSNTVFVNGTAVEMPPNSSAAAAVGAAGVAATRRSVTGQPRGPLCGMGICFECRATIDGEPHRLTCQTECAHNMAIDTELGASVRNNKESSPALRAERQAECAFDVVVVGGGPAGIMAAGSAATSG